MIGKRFHCGPNMIWFGLRVACAFVEQANSGGWLSEWLGGPKAYGVINLGRSSVHKLPYSNKEAVELQSLNAKRPDLQFPVNSLSFKHLPVQQPCKNCTWPHLMRDRPPPFKVT